MPEAEYDIKELSERGRVTPRTVHFYIQQGLLPPSGSAGPGARYGAAHLLRLRLIRLLQKQHLPLVEIAKRMKGLTDEQVEGLIAEAKQRVASDRGDALDYIRGVLSGKPDMSRLEWQASAATPKASRLLQHASMPAPAPSTAPSRSQWEHFTLADGIELHVRRPLARLDQKKLEQLLATARDIFTVEE